MEDTIMISQSIVAPAGAILLIDGSKLEFNRSSGHQQ
jgi:hypothetical protein